MDGLDLPSYLFGCLSVCCVIGLVWAAAVIAEDIYRTRRERALRLEHRNGKE